MTCREGVPLLTDYLEGALTVPVRHALDRHVSGCRRCQGFVRSYLATPRILRSVLVERMPARVGRDLRRRLSEEARRPMAAPGPRPGLWPARKKR